MNDSTLSNSRSFIAPACIIAASIVSAAFIVPARMAAVAHSGTTVGGTTAGSTSVATSAPETQRQLPIPEASVRQQVLEQLKSTAVGKTFHVSGQKRTLLAARITDIRPSHDGRSLLVSHVMKWEPSLETTVDVYFRDDNFGRYTLSEQPIWRASGRDWGGLNLPSPIMIK